MLKRLFDIAVSALALFFLGPVFLILSLLIKLDSRGPVFYKQARIGKDEILFNMYKFRKFRHDTGERGPGLSLANDERLTGVGKLLDQYKLNELPQFLNVLKGDMSIVGPRPETPEFVHKYGDGYSRVLKVKQGIFGVNQRFFIDESTLLPENEDVESFYLETILPLKIKNDIEYISKANLFYDIAILGRCIVSVLSGPLRKRSGKPERA
jgi:lipopolysaccharide/colanic/teichoic acid biosynthesis glycosyltransferase